MAAAVGWLHLPCGHLVRRKEHGFVSTDGQRVYDTQTCLDVSEGRKPQKYRDDDE